MESETSIFINKSSPIKWLKYELLCFLGFSRISYILDTIRRFRVDELDKLIEETVNFFTEESKLEKMIVVKFVTLNDYGQLYNLRIYNKRDPFILKKEILQLIDNSIKELWFCCSDVTKTPGNFSGRYLIDLRELENEIVELIWWTSPRLLESNILDSNYPYARYRKNYTSLSFSKDFQNIPNKCFLNENHMNNSFMKVIKLLTVHKKQIKFLKFLTSQLEIRSFSLEFKFQNGLGHFIDLDTSDDSAFLNFFLN